MAVRVLTPAPANTPPQTTPGARTAAVMIATEVITEVSKLERLMRKDEWLPATWVAKFGPTIRDRHDGMVLLHRGWNAIIETTINKSGDLTTLRAALIEMAGACLKVTGDLDGYLVGRTALAAEVDCVPCGQIPAVRAVAGRPKPDENDDEQDDAD